MKFNKKITLFMVMLLSVYQLQGSLNKSLAIIDNINASLSRTEANVNETLNLQQGLILAKGYNNANVQQVFEQGSKAAAVVAKDSTAMFQSYYDTFTSMKHPSVKGYSNLLRFTNQREKAVGFEKEDASKFYRYGLISAIAGTSLLVATYFSNDKKFLVAGALTGFGASYACHQIFKDDFNKAKKSYPLAKINK
jgi:hypothetical protein